MSRKNFFSGLEYLILLALSRLGREAYGVTVHRELCEQTGKNLSYGSVYKALKGLQAKGFVEPRAGESTPERGGRAKTYYDIKAEALSALGEYETAINNLKPAPA